MINEKTQHGPLHGGRRLKTLGQRSGPPRLTIVTVTRNDGERLKLSVDSVLALRRDDLDYIVIDGGSTDCTAAFLQSQDAHLEYWVSEPDAGIYHAMNKGVGLATAGSYLLFLGAGDRLIRLPDAAALQSATDEDARILYGDVLVGQVLFRSGLSWKLAYRNTVHHQGMFVRKKSTGEGAWFDESFRVFADWDFNSKLYKIGANARRLNYTVAYAEPGGLSARLHLSEIIRITYRHRGALWAICAATYHGALHLYRTYAGFPRSARQ